MIICAVNQKQGWLNSGPLTEIGWEMKWIFTTALNFTWCSYAHKYMNYIYEHINPLLMSGCRFLFISTQYGFSSFPRPILNLPSGLLWGNRGAADLEGGAHGPADPRWHGGGRWEGTRWGELIAGDVREVQVRTDGCHQCISPVPTVCPCLSHHLLVHNMHRFFTST